MKCIYDINIEFNNNDYQNLAFLKGSPFLIVNIATKCGFTPQLDELESIFKKYKDQGFQIIGIPTNDFGGQTPEENFSIQEFCQLNYGVNFLISKKVKAKSKGIHPLFNYININRPGLVKKIMWNFEKFLFDKEGNLVDSFRSTTKPTSKKVIPNIESLL
jgi:glutathione peroxidase